MKEIFKNQMLASLSTLNQCLRNCPESDWQAVHGDAPFSQCLFHALFFLDFYLSTSEEEFRAQSFHKENAAMFRDYEELENVIQKETYSREEITKYLQFCREKIENYFAGLTEEGLSKVSIRKEMNCAELAIYNTRHVQHHAAQLGVRLQQIGKKALKWNCGGWEE